MDSELGKVGKVDRTWRLVFGSQALLAIAAPLCLVWEYPDDGVYIFSLCSLVLVVGAGFSGFVGDLVVKWFPRTEWLFVPVVAVAVIVGTSLTWGLLGVVFLPWAGSFFEVLAEPAKVLAIVPKALFEDISLVGDPVFAPMLGMSVFASLQSGFFLTMCLWRRTRLWRMAYTFSLTLWVVMSMWCAVDLGIIG